MLGVQPRNPTDANNPLFSELLAIHALIREDQAKVTLLAEDASASVDGGEIARRVEALRASSLLGS